MINVLNQIRNELKNSPIHYLRAVEATTDGGNIVLTGNLSSYYQKQCAQAIVVGVTARKYRIINNINVKLRKGVLAHDRNII